MYSEEEKNRIFDTICDKIIEGKSLRSILSEEGMIPLKTFFIWIKDDEEKSNQYARAKEICAELELDEIKEIANHTEEDHTAFTGANVVQRDRLRIDAIKWRMAKMSPKKYGEKITAEITGKDGQPLIPVKGFIIEG